MARYPTLLLLAAVTSSCGWVGSLGSAISPFDGAWQDSTAFEPRLLGTWEFREDSTIVDRLIVTRTGLITYRIQLTDVESDSSVYYGGTVAAFGTKRILLELSAINPTPRSADSGRSREWIDFENPNDLMTVPIMMQVVIERADLGVRFFTFDADSLLEVLESGQIVAPFWVKGERISFDVLLTARHPDSLMSVLQRFAARPGALIPFPRVGHVVELPSWN